MNKKLKKGLTTTMAAAMGLGVVIPAVPVIAAPATSGWVNTAAGWTYYKAGTKVASAWVSYNNAWYYIDANGIMATGWRQVGGSWYYMDANGVMQKGWYKDATGTWYYSNPSGDMVSNKWVGNYYLGATGAMATSQLVNGWYVDANGAWDGKAQYDLAAVEAAVAKAEGSKLQADFDAAKALVNALPAIAEKTAFTTRLNAINVKVIVDSVSAANATTLTVSGSGLAKLAASDVTVAGNTVTAVTPAADGKSATVTLGFKLAVDQDYAVTVKNDGTTQDFTVKFTYDITSVDVTTAQVDDDAADQKISFNVNGAAADVDFLTNVAGYTVQYQSDKNVFADGTYTSATGKLDATKFAINDTFNVKVVLTKDGNVFSSAYKTVTVKNLNDTPAIGSIDVTNYGADKAVGGTDNFLMNSSTLVAGEKAAVTAIYSTTDDVIDTTGIAAGTYNFKSSNVGVATVDPSTGVITAIAPGTATITITAGTQTYTKTFTVTGTARKAATVAPAKTSYTLTADAITVPAAGYGVSVTAKDQYGDPIATAITATSTIGAVTGATSANADGKATITVNPATAPDAGTYPVYLKVGTAQLGSFNVVVTNDSVAATTKVESSDTALDLSGDLDTTVKVNLYSTAGGFVESLTGTAQTAAALVNLTDSATKAYTLNVQDPTIANVALAANGSTITVTGLATGSTKLVLKDANGVNVTGAELTITVTDSKVTVSSVAWKNPGTLTTVGKTVKLSDVLNVTTVAGDDIVTGLTLSKSTTSKVRLDEGNVATAAVLYLDVDDSGSYNTGDVVLGEVKASADPAFTPSGTTVTLTALTTDYTIAAGDKGNLIFTFTKDGAATPATSSVVVVNAQ